MQAATTIRNANPLLQETSTLGAPFWQILASTTGGLLTPALAQVTGSASTAEDSGKAGGGKQPAGEPTEPGAADEAEDPMAGKGLQAVSGGTPTDEPRPTETLLLAQRIVNAVTAQSANPHRKSGGPSHSTSAIVSQPNHIAIPVTATVLPQISIPALNTDFAAAAVQQALPKGNSSAVGADLQKVAAALNTTESATAGVDAAVRTAPVSSAALPATSVPAQSTADAPASTPAAPEAQSAPMSGAAKIPVSPVASADNLPPVLNAAQIRTPTAAPEAQPVQFQAATLDPTQPDQTQPIADAVKLTAPGDPTDMPSQSAAQRAKQPSDAVNRIAAQVSGQIANMIRQAASAQDSTSQTPAAATIATPEQSTKVETAPASASQAAAVVGAVSLALPPSYFPGNAAPAGQAGQNTDSAVSGSHASPSHLADIPAIGAKGSSNDLPANSEKSSQPDSNAGGSSGSAQTANGASNQNSQHPVDAGQASGAKSVETGTPVLQAVAHEVTSAPVGEHGGEAARTAGPEHAALGIPVESNESLPGAGLQTARLIQTISETGMQVGMRSSEFGDISIRTMVSQQQMMTQISVDHGDLSRTIAAHVPAVQAKLGDELGLHASIQVNQTGTSFSGDGSASGSQQRSYGNGSQAGTAVMAAEPEAIAFAASADDEDRLDIRA